MPSHEPYREPYRELYREPCGEPYRGHCREPYGENVKPMHPLSDKVFKRLGLQQFNSFREKFSNRARSY